MARLESVAVGGFYKTPTHVLPRIAALLDIPESTYECRVTFMDPCAGEAEAILALAGKNEIYACEMEATRWGKAKQALGWPHEKNLLHGDAFRISFARGDNDGISVLYLNPPYDTDPVHGRLEQRFLERFTAVLMDDGILLFLVPFYALKASAELLGREYSKLQCYRLPGADFDVFKQVLLVARKSDALFEPDPAIVGQVRAWAADASIIPELPEVGSEVTLKVPSSKGYHQGLHEWKMRTVDTKVLLTKLRPWHQTTRGGQVVPVPGIVPDLPVQDLLLRSYPVATPPRPAHIAAGIASGLFNGARIEPSDAKTGLPPLLVKGVFDREYRTVEEKKNKDGEVRAVVQVQQPKLVTTVLDLNTHQYHVLRTGAGESHNVDVSSMGVADLLKHYGNSLMEVMERQCPIMYDPRKDAASVELASSPRKLFTAQGHATRAVIKLLGGTKCSNRKGKAAILLGEIGSGKSTVALMTAKTIRSRRPLIMCPPHLLQSWTNEVSAVLPEAEVRILQSVADLDAVAQSTADHMIISVLSRETAKLGHGWVGAGPVCPKCGSETPKVDLGKKRARCEEKTLIPVNQLAHQCMSYARKLSKYNPASAQVAQILRGRHDRMRTAHYEKIRKEDGAPKFPGFQASDLDHVLVAALLDKDNHEAAQQALVMALALTGDEDRIERAARVLLARESYHAYDSLGRNLLLLLAPGGERQTALVGELSATNGRYSSWNPWASFKETIEQLKAGKGTKVGKLEVSWVDGALHIGDHKHDSIELATRLLHPMVKLARFRWTGECGEFLFQAVPEPRRVALAQHITKRHPDLFDLLVLDEGHEYATDGSAQERSAHRLTSLGIPVILQTGTIMNGYAESLFTNMWALSPDFRNEFSREDKQRFIDRYGYRKRIVEEKDKQTGEIVEFGSMSDRVTRSERIVGNAPGVLPLFLLRHLLKISVTLHKADLAIDLPACKQEVCYVQPSAEQRSNYEKLKTALAAAIKKDQFSPDLAGKLFGQLAELPSYLDRATRDTGNTEHGDFEVRYPESVGANLVASARPISESELLPKEQWMVDTITRELSEGRNVMVFSWHVNLLPRYARIISERLGEQVPILYADKVPTAKRQAWIDKEVVKKKRHILVTNPVAIQTGLNNLVHFASEIWMENPGCNPVIFRQAIGRVDRIGQKKETRIFFPIYADTLQVQLYDLLMKKVAVSVSTDGLDPESALQAAGVGEDDYLAGLSIGKQLWAMLTDGEYGSLAA